MPFLLNSAFFPLKRKRIHVPLYAVNITTKFDLISIPSCLLLLVEIANSNILLFTSH